jgi:hypothetical protein
MPQQSAQVRVRVSNPLSQKVVSHKKNVVIRNTSTGRLTQTVAHSEDVDDEIPQLEDVEESDDEDGNLDLPGLEEDEDDDELLDDTAMNAGDLDPESATPSDEIPTSKEPACCSSTYTRVSLKHPLPGPTRSRLASQSSEISRLTSTARRSL